MNGTTSNGSPGAARLPSTVFDFEVLSYIGRGAGSTLYAVSHPQTSQLYALKHVVVNGEKDDRYVEQLEAEYEVGKAVTHEGLRRSVEVRVKRNLLRRPLEAILLLELFDGLPLDQSRPRNVLEAVKVFVQVAHALGAMHQVGYVHCDLKPNNILVNGEGKVKVIDLGQACKVNTVKKRIQGTPDYMSPEQVKCEAVSPQTDIYNLGATLYWALTGKNVPTLYTLKRSDNSFLVDAKIDSPAQLNPRVPENLSNLVMECVRVNRAKRPATMEDVARRLEIIEFSLQRAAAAARRSQRVSA